MAALGEQRPVAAREPDKGMSAGIADRIGLGLDDASGQPLVRQLAHQGLADQIAGKLRGVCWQLSATQPTNAPHVPTRSGAPILRSAAMTDSATMRPVFGFSD